MLAKLEALEAQLAEARENERKARLLANQNIPSKARTPPKTHAHAPVVHQQK